MAKIEVTRIQGYPVTRADLTEAYEACLGRVEVNVDGRAVPGHIIRENATGHHRVDLPFFAREEFDLATQHEIGTACLDAFLADAQRQNQLREITGPQRVTPSWARGDHGRDQDLQR